MRVLITLLNKGSTTKYPFLYANRFEQEIAYMVFSIYFQIEINAQLKLTA